MPPELAAVQYPLGKFGDDLHRYIGAWSFHDWQLYRQLVQPAVWKLRKEYLDSRREQILTQYDLPRDLPDYALDKIVEFLDLNLPCSDCDGSTCKKRNGQFYTDSFTLVRYDDYYDVQRYFEPCKAHTLYKENIKRQSIIQTNRAHSNVPRRFADLDFDDFISTSHNRLTYHCAMALAENLADKGLFISGPPGVGKTMLLSIVANRLIKNLHQVFFFTVPVLLRSIKATFENNSSVSTDRLCRSVSEAPVLFLDDFGAERTSEWVAEQLFNIVNFRYESLLPTFFSSNFDLDEIKSKMSIDFKTGRTSESMARNASRLFSRIHSMCHICSIIDDDWRQLS